MNITELIERLDEFCVEYRIPKRYHGSLRLLANMAFVLGVELKPRSIRKMRPSDIGLERELLPLEQLNDQ